MKATAKKLDARSLRRLKTALRKYGAAVLKLPAAIQMLAAASPAQRAAVKAVLNEPAGLLYRTTNPTTGAVGSVYVASEQGIDVDTKYAVVCETHSCILEGRTLKIAKFDAGRSWDWCESCQDIERASR